MLLLLLQNWGSVSRESMRDILQNLDSLANCVSVDITRRWFEHILEVWLRFLGFNLNSELISQFLDEIIFAPKTAKLLGKKVVWGYEIRKANFVAIINFWKTNPVLNTRICGAPCVLDNVWNRCVVGTVLTEHLINSLDSKTFLSE
jgi:hypothetical protein